MAKWLLRMFSRLMAWLARLVPGRPRSRRPRQAYAVIEIPTLGGVNGAALDVNNHGVVVGWAEVPSGQAHGYRWDSGAMLDLGSFPGPGPGQSQAYAVNDHGFVGGQSQMPPTGADAHGYVVPPGTKIALAHDVGTLGGANSVVLDFSADHIAVGWADDPNGKLHAFVRMQGGPMIDLTPGLASSSSAEAVDSAGRVAGVMGIEAFRWSAGGGLVPMMPPGASFSRAFGITYREALVVGEADFGVGARATVWDKNNAATDLGTLGGPHSVAYDVNDFGEIVGASDVASGGRHAFITTIAGPMVDLNSLIPANSGWVLTEAKAINGQGQVVGNGTLKGRSRGFLLT
jgi:probable HAF family extracellular repeat protein